MDNPVLRFIRLMLVDNWPITLVAALGFVAVYLLLPRPRAGSRTAGVAAAALALLLAGALIVRAVGVTWDTAPEVVLFYAFSGIAVIAGGLLVTQSNPARAALSFALVVLSTCGLFLLQAAPFLMAATTIIYAGAIIVTFLFVLMLAQQEGVSDADQRSREPLLASLTGFVLLGALLYVLQSGYGTDEIDKVLSRVREAREKPTVREMAAALGDEGDNYRAFFDGFRKAIVRGGDSSQARALAGAVDNLQDRWVRDVVPGGDPDAGRKLLDQLDEVGRQARASYGALQPPAGTPLSSLSGPPAGQALFPPQQPARDGQGAPAALRRDADGRPQLPHENTAYLGRALFTDYLLAVELGGTLLLVATVGAIAIAGRRGERRA
jgi:NADH:ubiquinone oxidoreductase subunit 6 (subunit J)